MTRDREDRMPDTNSRSDALVFFGASGDLSYKKIFPALQAMVKRGHLEVPVIGVAKAGWNLVFRARALDSLEHHGGVDPDAVHKLSGLLATFRRKIRHCEKGCSALAQMRGDQ